MNDESKILTKAKGNVSQKSHSQINLVKKRRWLLTEIKIKDFDENLWKHNLLLSEVLKDIIYTPQPFFYKIFFLFYT